MPNRKQRRHDPKDRKKYSLHDVQKAINIALTMKKYSKGHLFSKTLKDKCVFCGTTTKTRKTCQYWFLTFIDRTQTVLINPSFFRDNEIQVFWLQNSSEYQEIKLPLNFTEADNEKD